MDGLEADIATYLTIDGQVFIAPQYDIKWEMNEGGTCPDFIALDFSCREVVVVEVTTAANWPPLAERVRARESRWFSPISRRLTDLKVIDADWNIRFLGFVRKDATEMIAKQFLPPDSVTFYAIEDAIILWRYWDDRMKGGLPGNRRSTFIPSV
jgi:hypothetical protein